jgi:hypothetical protein
MALNRNRLIAGLSEERNLMQLEIRGMEKELAMSRVMTNYLLKNCSKPVEQVAAELSPQLMIPKDHLANYLEEILTKYDADGRAQPPKQTLALFNGDDMLRVDG